METMDADVDVKDSARARETETERREKETGGKIRLSFRPKSISKVLEDVEYLRDGEKRRGLSIGSGRSIQKIPVIVNVISASDAPRGRSDRNGVVSPPMNFGDASLEMATTPGVVETHRVVFLRVGTLGKRATNGVTW